MDAEVDALVGCVGIMEFTAVDFGHKRTEEEFV